MSGLVLVVCGVNMHGFCVFLGIVATKRRRKVVYNEVLPGFEPGSLDSESRVLTITP